jgi:ribosomal protein L40E
MDMGDPYRLEHIKSRLDQNKKLTLSDTKYLNGLLTLSNLRDVESIENQIITTRHSIPLEVNSEFTYCWNCNAKNPMANAYCTNCESEIGMVKSTIEIRLPKKVSLTKKIRTELVILGFILLIFGSGAFIVPFGETGWFVQNMNSFCESALGLTTQVFFEEQRSKDCTMAFQLLLLANFLVIIGVILMILGFCVKKTVFQNKPKPELK